jgi:long-chain fatty acid transport protein
MTIDILRTAKNSRLWIAVVSLALVSLGILEASASLLVSEEGISPGHSAEYVRTLSRNSSTEPDAMYYNPAGLSFLPNGGIYIMINSLNTYAQKKSSLDLWGYQGINASNNLSAPLTGRFQSPYTYASSVLVAMPSDFGFIFKRDNWSVFCSVSTLHGQPGATYTQSASMLDRLMIAYNSVLASQLSQQLVNVYGKSYFKRKEVHIGATVGGSYAITDMIAASLAVRYINVQSNTRISQTPLAVLFTNGVLANSYQVPTDINTDAFGHGAGIIIGFDFKPLDKLNIGTRLEYYPPMVLAKRTNRFITNPVMAQTGMLNIFTDSIWPLVLNDRLNPGGLGNIFNILTMDPRTLKNISNRLKATYPTSLSAGVSYSVIPALKLAASVDLNFPRARDLDGRERDWRPIGYRLGQSIEWTVVPWVIVSAGYSYHDFGIRLEKTSEYDDLLPSHTIGAGCTFRPQEWLDITVGGSYSFYTSLKVNHDDIINSTIFGNRFVYGQEWKEKLSRNEWCVSLGVTFSMYPVSAIFKKKAEEHYWKGMSLYFSNDIDSAVDEMKSARTYNPYYRDVDKKVRELTEVQKFMKKNIEIEKEKEEKGMKEKGNKGEDEK